MTKKRAQSIFQEVKVGDVALTRKKLEKNANPNEKDKNGRTPLHWACQEGHIKIIHLLIEFGAQVNVSCKEGFTPLVMAAGEGHYKIVQELLKAGADVNARVHSNSDGTALHLACAWDRLDVVKALLEMSEVDINAKDRDGKTPLAYVLESGINGDTGDKKLAKYLIQRGAVC